MTFDPALELSRADELRVTLRWTAILRDHVSRSLAATGGVHEATDVVKALLVGADVVMIASALIKHGPEHLVSMYTGVGQWLDQHEYQSIRQMKGSMSERNCADPQALKRANYVKALTSFSAEGSIREC